MALGFDAGIDRIALLIVGDDVPKLVDFGHAAQRIAVRIILTLAADRFMPKWVARHDY